MKPELEPTELPEALQPDEGVTGHLAVVMIACGAMALFIVGLAWIAKGYL